MSTANSTYSLRSLSDRPRIVIIGGGFAGLNVAKGLARADVDVVIVDRRNHHVFQPLLYQVATAGLNPSDIAHPIRSILRHQQNATVLLGEVTGVDPENRTIELDGHEQVGYDRLILATGARHAYFGNDQWAEYAVGLKTIEDALDIRRRVLVAFEKAEREADEAVRRALLTFVVVGGGPTGVELAGAITEIALRTLTDDFRSIDPGSARVVLIEAQHRVLPGYSPASGRAAANQLHRLGVDVRTDTRVTSIDADGLETAAGRIDARTVLWAAGVAASPLAQALEVPLDRSGRVLVSPDLSVPGHPDVLVVGDLAAAKQRNGEWVPGVAPAAVQAGRHAARVIEADLAGRRRPRFHYRNKGSLATIGRGKAVADLGRFGSLSGVPAWILWSVVHLWYLNGFRNKLMVWLGWTWQWITFQREARLITDPTEACVTHIETRQRERAHR